MKFSVFRDRKKKKLSFTFSSPFSLRVSWWNIVANALLLESNDKSGKRNPILMGFIFPTTIAMVFVLLFLPPTLHHIPRFFISVTAFYVHMLTTPHREQHHECKNDIHQKNGTEKNHHETFWSFGFFYSIMINGRTWKQKKENIKFPSFSLWTHARLNDCKIFCCCFWFAFFREERNHLREIGPHENLPRSE